VESRPNGEQWGEVEPPPNLKYVSPIIPKPRMSCQRGNKPSARKGKREGDAGGYLVRERKAIPKGKAQRAKAFQSSITRLRSVERDVKVSFFVPGPLNCPVGVLTPSGCLGLWRAASV